MIVDASALIAILRGEPDALEIAQSMKTAEPKVMAAPTYLEVCMVIVGRKGPGAKSDVDHLIANTGISIVPFSATAAHAATIAFIRFGKGRHPAGLNFGDCISYALAKTELMPLLFKGDDFRLTDIEAAL
ncbi:MAG: type II toxin-antitoxin system VapC family toxin [Hyphomicrobiales bacterium]